MSSCSCKLDACPKFNRTNKHPDKCPNTYDKKSVLSSVHCQETKEESFPKFNCSKQRLTEKLVFASCKTHFRESDIEIQYNQQVWHAECFKCQHCTTSLKPTLAVLDKHGRLSCQTCPLTQRIPKKRPCKQCGLHASKREYRGLKIQTGEVLCFYNKCLFCSVCHRHFPSLEFYTDGEHFYHPECVQQHTTYDFSNQSVICTKCSQYITDSAYLELAKQFCHKKCLLCVGCHKTVPIDTQLKKIDGKLYCDHCGTPNSFTKMIITSPSDIFKSRKTTLPRLGGVRVCVGCNQGMPFSDYQPGPNASRWHKKCLRCAGCKKQMDSDAHMAVDQETGLHSVHCRHCLDETPKPNYVR